METWRSYATVCRLCLQKDGFMLGIFNHIQGKDKSIYKKIIDCTALQISQGDGLPNVICHRCLFKIEFCLEFRQLCFMSDATLRQINGVVAKETGVDGSNITSNLPLIEQLAGGNDENVVMVVDPHAFDYESSYESEKEQQSENENGEANETNDIEPESRGVTMCKYCDHAFTDSNECHNHEMTYHNSDTPYSCGSCYMSFADRVLYSAHLKSVHKNDKPYNCPQCDRTFARRSDLRKHTIVHTGVKPYTCTVCYKSFSRNTNLSKHKRIHAGSKPFVCPKCPKTFTSKENLARHSVIHTGQKPFSCNYCHLSFGRRDKLQRHEKRHFPQENTDKESLIMRDKELHKELQIMRENLSIYSTPNDKSENEARAEGSENMVINLDPFNHNSYNEGTTPQRVDNTDEFHNDSRELSNDDMENFEGFPVNNEEDVDPVKMEEGENTVSAVNGERKQTRDLRPFKCQQCPKRFSKMQSLKVHQVTHSGARPFTCHICNKTFVRKREMDRHIATHSGVKPFKCPRCNKSFGRKDKMIRHMRIHDINKSFNCNLCGGTFNRRDSLQQHMKIHTKEETQGDITNLT